MIKKIIPYVVLLACLVAGLRFAPTPAIAVWILVGVFSFGCKKYGVVAFILGGLLFSQTLSHQLMGESSSARLLLRMGIMSLIALCIFARITALSRIRRTLPMGALFVYVLYMVLPSTFGWFPVISYLKIVLFLLFAYGLICCAYLVATSATNLETARISVMAIAAFCIWASVATYWVPSIGYSMQISKAASWGISEYDALNMSGVRLFSGIFFHSQTMGPVITILAAVVLCDMFFVEKRFELGHLLIVAPSPLLAYMSRSRTALLTLGVVMMVGFLVIIRKKDMATIVRRRVQFAAWIVCGIMICAAITLEVTRGTMSSWIFKGMNYSAEGYVWGDVTATRRGKAELNLYDFKRNPWIGKGFQTQELHKELFKAGVINYFSAPVEKGIMPLMILGEGGIIGAIIFLGFISAFYKKCSRYGYSALIILMSGFLAANMGEATFFSPSGAGGDYWFVCIIGGWIIDLLQASPLVYGQRVAVGGGWT